MPGGHDMVKINKKRKKQSKEDEKEKALNRVKSKLGEAEAKKVQGEYSKCNQQQGEGVILTLIASGLSGSEIKSLFPVDGDKVTRLQKRSKMSEEEIDQLVHRPPPSHACSILDQEACTAILRQYDIEPGYPCSHREPLQYFADPTIKWTDVYGTYSKERQDQNA